MSPNQPDKPKEEFTPRQYLEVIGLGTGKDLDRRKLVEYLKKNGGEVIRETRRLIREHTGFEPNGLKARKDTNGMPPTSSRLNAKEQAINAQLKAKLEFLQKYKEEKRESGLSSMGYEADKYIRQLISDVFPGDGSASLNGEIASCNDAAKLVLWSFDDRYAPIIKFEAARKLLLMKFIAEIRDYSKQEEDNDKALQYMMDVFNERVVDLPEGGRIGDTVPHYLLSTHDPEDYRTVDAKLLKQKPNSMEGNRPTQLTKLPCRRTIVINLEGEEREIFFYLDQRGKTPESRLTKTLRYGSKIGEKDLDRNGFKLVFEEREDWEDFFRMFQEEIKNEVKDDLYDRMDVAESEEDLARLQARIDNIDESIEIDEKEWKDSLDGKGFKGNGKGSSENLKVLKFKMKVTRGDGRKHQYEFQIFLPDGFADTEYRKGVSWDEYHAKRFFKEKLDEVLFPPELYPDIDRKKSQEEAMKQAHEKVWGDQAAMIQSTPQSSGFFASILPRAIREGVLPALRDRYLALKARFFSLLDRVRGK